MQILVAVRQHVVDRSELASVVSQTNHHDANPTEVGEKWPRLSEQQTPIIKWRLGGLKRDVALSTGCARRAVELT